MMSKTPEKFSFLAYVASGCAWFFLILLTVGVVLFTIIFLLPYTFFFERHLKRTVHWAAVFWGKVIMRMVPMWKLKISGLENIRPGQTYVIAANHQSVLDIIVALAAIPIHFKFMAKKELFSIPFLGWHLTFAGYIPLERGNPHSGRDALARASSWIGRQVSVLFFPEGTRSETLRLRQFKAGAFRLACQEHVPILPVVLCGTGEAIPKKTWIIRSHSAFTVSIGRPVEISEEKPLEVQIENIRNEMQQRLDEIAAHDGSPS